MKKLIVCLLAFLVLSGCAQKTETQFKEYDVVYVTGHWRGCRLVVDGVIWRYGWNVKFTTDDCQPDYDLLYFCGLWIHAYGWVYGYGRCHFKSSAKGKKA